MKAAPAIEEGRALQMSARQRLSRVARALGIGCAVLLPFAFLCAIMIGRIAASGHDTNGEPGGRVIAEGRESDVMTFLGSDSADFAGVPINNVRIDRNVVFLDLEARPPLDHCAAGAQSPGVVSIAPAESASTSWPSARAADLLVAWSTCSVSDSAADAAGERLAQHLAQRPHDRVWTSIPGQAPGGVGGILAPFIRSQPFAPGLALTLVFSMAALLSILAALVAAPNGEGALPPIVPSSRRLLVGASLLALVAAGIVLRMRAASHLPLDTDEAWAFPSVHSIVTNDHDAWVHPPMHRALHQAWVEAIGWHEGDTLTLLRAPWLLASIASLLLLFGRVGLQGELLGGVALVGVALAPVIVDSSVLARPYGLAVLGVVLVLVSLFPRVGQAPTRIGWLIALLGTALAAWTDLIAGLAAVTLLICALAQLVLLKGRRSIVQVVLALLATCAFCAPLVPGAAAASREQVLPAPAHDQSSGPDLRASHGIGGGEVIGLVPAVASFGVGADPASGGAQRGAFTILCFASFALVATSARRARDLAAAVAPWALVALCVVAGRGVALRARNILFLPHATALFAASAIADQVRRSRHARDEAKSPSCAKFSVPSSRENPSPNLPGDDP